MEIKNRYSNDVMLSALSGLLFFSPFIKSTLKKNPQGRNAESQAFVASRCQVGVGVWLFFLLFILSYGIGVWSQIVFFFSLAEVFGYLLVTVLFLAFPFLISGKYFEFTNIQQDTRQRKQMLSSFIPLYSSYQRFRLKSFDKPYWRLKEAQVWLFGIWFLMIIFHSPIPWIILGALMFLRIGLLGFGYDIISQQQKVRINASFHILPWEMVSLMVVQIQVWWAKLLKKPFNVQESLLTYQVSYHSKKTRKVWLLSLLIWVSIRAILAWSWWNAELWRKLIPGVWALLWSMIIFSTKPPLPKFPFIAEFTARKEI